MIHFSARKTFALALVGFLLVSAAFPQGIYIEQNVGESGEQANGTTSLVKIWIDKGNIRFDEEQITIIIDQRTGKATSINHGSKTYYETTIKEEEVNQALDQDIKEFKNAYKKTGQTKKIDGWNCYEVTHKPAPTDGVEMVSTIWYTEDLGVNWYEVYMIGQDDLFQKIKKYAERDKSILNNLPKGFPVWTISTTKKGGRTRKQEVRLKKFEKVVVASDKFKIPTDYKKSDNPLAPP